LTGPGNGTVIYLDTHVVAWLYAGLPDLLSAPARDLLETGELLISPMVLLELEYLYETERTTVEGAKVFTDLQAAIGLQLCNKEFPVVVAAAAALRWTRDPFDRLIVAQAAVNDDTLITKDRTILAHYPRALW